MLRDRVVLSWRAASGRVPFFGVLAAVGHAGFGDAQQVERRDQHGAPVLPRVRRLVRHGQESSDVGVTLASVVTREAFDSRISREPLGGEARVRAKEAQAPCCQTGIRLLSNARWLAVVSRSRASIEARWLVEPSMRRRDIYMRFVLIADEHPS